MPALSDVNICNLSLLSIGARVQIANLNEGSDEANACKSYYPFVFNSLARSANWNCLRYQAILSLIAAAPNTPENQGGTTLPSPPQPWLYAYTYPSDCLRLRLLLPTIFGSAVTGAVPIYPVNNMSSCLNYGDGRQAIPFTVAYGKDQTGNPIEQILTNLSQAQAVYTISQSNPSSWDSQFQSAMVASLAAYLVPALSLNLSFMSAQVSTAERLIAEARASDGNETFVTQNREASWIYARNRGGYTGEDGSGACSGGYGNMSWPG